MIVGPGTVAFMNLTVQFDCKAFCRTIKIEDVVSDAVLTSKFSTYELGSFQCRPQSCFSRSEGRSQFSSKRLKIRTAIRPISSIWPFRGTIWLCVFHSGFLSNYHPVSQIKIRFACHPS